MMEISSLDTLILDLPPSCIEFWGLHPEYLVVGTYNLEKQEVTQEPGRDAAPEEHSIESQSLQQRTGSIVLCKLAEDEIQIIQTLPTDFAILDLHFAYEIASNGEKRDTKTLWTATSTGSIASYDIVFPEKTSRPLIQRRPINQIQPKDILILSFCFHPTNPSILAATTSTGEINIFSIQLPKETLYSENNPHLTHRVTVSPHALEAWTCVFLEQNHSTVMLSGGDDAILQSTTIQEFGVKERSHDVEPPHSTKLPRKFHNAGVTAILPLSQEVILTGSYDDTIRLIRLLPRPSLLFELNLSGGVWRLKTLSARGAVSFDILASCMHAGTRILRVELEPEAKITVLAKFEEHESMNYGSGVQPRAQGSLEEQEREYTVVSTSFYDRRMCLWKFQM